MTVHSEGRQAETVGVNTPGAKTLPAPPKKDRATRVEGDPCPQCNEADLEPYGGKHKCPICAYIQPCCQPGLR